MYNQAFTAWFKSTYMSYMFNKHSPSNRSNVIFLRHLVFLLASTDIYIYIYIYILIKLVHLMVISILLLAQYWFFCKKHRCCVPWGVKEVRTTVDFWLWMLALYPPMWESGTRLLVTSITSFLRTCTLPTIIYGYSYDLFRFCTIYILIIMMHIKVDIHLI